MRTSRSVPRLGVRFWLISTTTSLPIWLIFVKYAPPVPPVARVVGCVVVGGAMLASSRHAPFEILDHLMDSSKTIDAAQLLFEPLCAQSIPYRRARLDYLHPNVVGRQLVCETAQRRGALQVHVR